ncbi:MAG: outer membrane lipoprotein-sorting protein [Vicinamibacteria bacterium]|nr:outer membrane lipoprotein-sorting protein [Vicinamibacteria bacterium]
MRGVIPSFLLAALALAAAATVPGQSSTPNEATRILEKAQAAVLGETASYTLRMTVHRTGKSPRVVTMEGFKSGDDRGLVRYTDPPKEKGTVYLRREENTYIYLPAAEKVARVGPKQTFGGGDFNNGDIFRLSLTRDYEATLAGEEAVDGVPCHVLELKARNRGVAYDRVRYLVRKDGTFFPCLAEYFTISGKKLKVLRSDEIETLGGRKRPTRMIMESALESGASTELKFLKIDDRPKLDERMFSPASLERER